MLVMEKYVLVSICDVGLKLMYSKVCYAMRFTSVDMFLTAMKNHVGDELCMLLFCAKMGTSVLQFLARTTGLYTWNGCLEYQPWSIIHD